nr:hypothetical protein CFP56_66833 [Quercus suber]
MAKAQTIKQARAAFKARNYDPLSDRAKRQIERSIELDKRACKAKELEKRKSEAALKRKQKERDEAEKRRATSFDERTKCDRFGHESSQYHLEAFFAKGKIGHVVHAVTREEQTCGYENDGDFDEELVDDDSLYAAMNAAGVHPPQNPMLPPSKPDHEVVAEVSSPSLELPQQVSEDLLEQHEGSSDLVQDRQSSFHMARQLQSDNPSLHKKNDCEVSFGSVGSDFDLSIEEIEALEASLPVAQKDGDDRRLMPPPILPITFAKTAEPETPSARKKRSPNAYRNDFKEVLVQHQTPFTSNFGFTMSQLETFIDDDLQLTQTAP